MRPTRYLVPLLLLFAMPIASSSAASAQTGTVAVSPTTNLVELQSVTVSGSGWSRDQSIFFCEGSAGTTGCGTKLEALLVDATGAFSTSLTVRRFIYVAPLGRTIDCANPVENCEVFVDAFSPDRTIFHIPISFAAAPAPPATRGSITVAPDHDVQSGTLLTVAGSGFRPHATIELLQCTPTSDDPTECNFHLYTSATTDADGEFVGQYRPTSVVITPPGIGTNCRDAPGACVIAAAEVVDIPGTIVNAGLSFAAHALTTLSAVPSTDLVDGQVVQVSGSGFEPTALVGAQVGWCEAVRTSAPSQSDCGQIPTLNLTSADAQGSFSGSVALRRFMFVPSLGTTVDCANPAEACVLAAASITDIAGSIAYAQLEFRPILPVILPSGVTVVEGSGGAQNVAVPVTLSEPSSQTVTVEWTTLPVAGGPDFQADPSSDYTPASGTVTFAPGQTAQSVAVSVNGDLEIEHDEYFVVSFRNPTNANVGGFYGLGFGVIENDDHPPVVLPGGVTAAEGGSGAQNVAVPVTLSEPSSQTVTVEWTTLPVAGGPDFQADPSSDYTPASGTVTFAPGQTAQSVAVSVNGDLEIEHDEYFIVSFWNPTNANIGGFYGLGFGVIQNDD